MSRSLPVLSIFDRYLLREFLRFFFLAFVGFVGFVVLFDAFEKISTFIDHKATAGQVFRYYFNATPYKAVLVTPIALLLATFLSLGYMTRFHEITIMRSSGISLYRILMPVYVVGLLVAATSFLVSDFIMPGAQTRAREILQQEIRGRTAKNLGSRMNVSYIGQNNRFYLIRRYDVPRSAMVDVVIQEFDGDTLTRRIDASKASYEDGAWV
ncbi:MAG: LptF/LptG family permease, partial [Candidatus Eisenbacteria bacterium]|nr:LptF/LptG family permease [Candidatus Eisenbacteria bacterium]